MDTIPAKNTYLSSKIIHEDENGDGFFERQTTEQYALNGQLFYKVYEQRDSDNRITYIAQSNYTYDSQDYLVSILTEIDQNNDGFDSTDYHSYSYDAKGNLLTEIFESDKKNDDFIDYRSTITNIYDDYNRLTSNISIQDVSGDNDENDYLNSMNTSAKYTYTYNDNGLISSKTYDTYGGYYGATNYHYTYTYTYDENNKLSSELSAGYSELKTLRFPSTVFSQFIYEYNSVGKLISEIKEIDSLNDGAIDGKEATYYIYDDNDRLFSRINKLDKSNNGIVDELRVESWNYDNNGNLNSRIYEFDRRNDGIIDDRIIQEYTYDSMGNMLSEIYRNETDYPPNGAIELRSARQTSYYYQPIVKPGPVVIPDPGVIQTEPTPPATIITNTEELPSPRLDSEPIVDYRPVLLNLQEITGLVTVNFILNREAAFDNFVGFYQVIDDQGGIDINDDGRADLVPGEDGYTAAVLANYETQIALTVANRRTSVFKSELAGGSLYAPFLVANGRPQDPSLVKSEAVYFAFSAANIDGAEHIRLIDGRLCFEDWFGGGDNDFNDAVIQVVL